MNTVAWLLKLIKADRPPDVIRYAARAVVNKVILKLPTDMPAHDLIKLWN